MTHPVWRALCLASCAALAVVPAAGHAGTLTTLHSFSGLSDGATPGANLFYLNGALYGTTEFGGTTGISNCPDGCGVLFRMDPKTGKETVLYSFQGGTDGAFPAAGLIYANGLFYGTTELGGGQKCFDSTAGCGTVFQFDPATGAETTLYPFGNGGVHGELVLAGVTLVNGVLYGTTSEGGTGQVGNIYSYNLGSGIGSNLYSFTGYPDQDFPEAGLANFDNTLYGTTTGEAQDFGSVFAFAPQSGIETLLHHFSGLDGAHPLAGLVAYKGMLYGTTAAGGETQHDAGTVFKINPRTGAESVVYSFGSTANDGISPAAGLIVVGKMLYGTTMHGGGYAGCPGGSEGCGTIFEVDPATGQETVLYSFTGKTDEGNPAAGLLYKNGAFYGTTAVNGVNSCYNKLGCGTVFKFVQ
jgi:uncharacterized repeat protein (TIGR03803 family)